MSTTTDDDASDTALGLAPPEVEDDEETALYEKVVSSATATMAKQSTTAPFYHGHLSQSQGNRCNYLLTRWLELHDMLLCHSTCTNSGFPANIFDVVNTGQYEHHAY